jgi:membrane dipeptidase
MNRLGMLIDLSHVSDDVMRQVLQTSRSPVIFSHSSARALDDHRRNVPDDILPLVAKNGGVVMVNFYNGFLSEDFRKWSADESAEEARLKALFPASKDQREAGIKAWTAAHPAPVVNVGLIADHVEHIVKIAGYDNVGIGADLDGIPYDQAPQGMNSVSAYPLLFAELIRRGWSDANLSKLAGANVLRAMRQNEATAKAMQSERPSLATLEPAR